MKSSYLRFRSYFLLLSVLLVLVGCKGQVNMLQSSSDSIEISKGMSNKALVQNALTNIFDKNISNNVISKIYSPFYMQFVDSNRKNNYHQFMSSVQILKKNAKHIDFKLKHLIAEGDYVYALYIINIIQHNKVSSTLKISAIYRIERGQIVYSNEDTNLVSGQCIGGWMCNS